MKRYLIFLFLLLPSLAQATTRYVDATAGACSGNYSIAGRNCSGADGTSYATIAAGVSWLQANPTSNILYLRSGTYTGSGAIISMTNNATSVSGTSWNDAPMIAGYPGETVTLAPGGGLGSGGGAILSLPASGTFLHYLIFKNLVLDGTSMSNGTSTNPGAQGVSFGSEGNDVHHIRFEDVEIKNMPSNGVAGRGNYHEWIRVSIHNNGLGTQTAGYSPGANGVYWATGTGNVFKNSTFYDNLCFGVRIYDSGVRGASSNSIYSSSFYNNGKTKAFSGASTCNSSGGGLLLGDDSNVAHHNLFYNNYISLAVTYGGKGSALNNLIYNNTVYGSTVGYQIEWSQVSGTVFKNNIGIGNTTNWQIGGTSSSMSYNACAAANSCGTTGKLTITAITDCTVSTSDFTHKAASTCIDAGVAITGYTYNGSAPDIGAFEVPVFASCVVENGDASNMRVTFTNNANPPMLPASNADAGGFTTRKAGAANAVTATTRVGDNRVDLTLTNAIVNGNAIDVSYTPGGAGDLTDSALIGNSLNQPYITTLSQQSCTNNVGAAASHLFIQAKFEFHDLRGTEAAPVVKPYLTAPENTDTPIVPGGKVRLRIALTCSNADCPPTGFYPFYACAACTTAGTYTLIPDTFATDEDIALCGTNTDTDIPNSGTATTDQLSTAGTFVAGALVRTSNAIPTIDLAQNNKTELEYCIAFDTDAVADRVYTFRVYKQDSTAIDTYTVTPQVTVRSMSAGVGF